jgi:hypothetical protein
MIMEKESRETWDEAQVLQILSKMEDQMAKLEDLPDKFQALKTQFANLESPADQKTASSEFPVTSGNISNNEEKQTMEELELRDQRIAEMETQIVHLESPEHRYGLILEWLNTLDQDSYYALGVRKCYLEEVKLEPEESAPGKLREPDPEVQFSREKPEDLTGS